MQKDADAEKHGTPQGGKIAEDAAAGLTPGAFVMNPQAPEWGLGQVQSAIGTRITVNFENEGKLVLDAGHVSLTLTDP